MLLNELLAVYAGALLRMTVLAVRANLGPA
jgi:hypothetical protein